MNLRTSLMNEYHDILLMVVVVCAVLSPVVGIGGGRVAVDCIPVYYRITGSKKETLL